jgi:uncharacterized membrane protein SpoIIM required for sporulation
MRETKFIAQNKDKWSRFEHVLKEKQKDPEELSNLFMELSDDLSYSRTFYPNRSVRVYLNGLAQKVFYSIYRNKKGRLKKFWQFWREDIPQILFESRFDLLLSFLIFILSISIGVFSSMMDPEFCRSILGDGYVDMTLKNIEKVNPMSVYQDPDQTTMFMQITFNNLRVAFFTFILGLLFGVGTIFILISNGIMVGAFQYLFFQHGVYWDSLLTIWLHGAIEISSIVIAGAAGIHLGRGLLFPGTYSRLQGLQLSARRALQIYLSIAPLIIMAGFIESFITRYSDSSYLVRAILILVSFAFMIGYFVIYPWLKARRGFTANLREVEIPAVKKTEIALFKIKNSSQILRDSFIFYRTKIKYLGLLAALLALSYYTFIPSFVRDFNLQQNNDAFLFFESFFTIAHNSIQLICPHRFNLHWLANVLAMSAMSYMTLLFISKLGDYKARNFAYYLQAAVSTIVICGFINSLLILNDNEGFVFISFIFIFPVLILWLSVNFNEGKNLFNGFIKTMQLIRSNWASLMGSYLLMLLLCSIFLFFTSAPLLGILLNFSSALIPLDENSAADLSKFFILFVQIFSTCFLFPLVFSAISIAQFSFRENEEAIELYEQFEKVGQGKKSYGMEKEEILESL